MMIHGGFTGVHVTDSKVYDLETEQWVTLELDLESEVVCVSAHISVNSKLLH